MKDKFTKKIDQEVLIIISEHGGVVDTINIEEGSQHKPEEIIQTYKVAFKLDVKVYKGRVTTLSYYNIEEELSSN